MLNDVKTVYRLRKEGKNDEAYIVAKQLYEAQPDDDWVNRAMFFTLYDKIKASAGNLDNGAITLLKNQIAQLKLPEDNQIINNCLRNIKIILDPYHNKLQQAKELSKQGSLRKAVEIYKSIISNYSDDEQINNSYGWDLYRLAKEVLNKSPANFRESKLYLNDYIKLSNTRPSNLHSCVLQLALKLAKDEKLDIIAFVKMWDLNKFETKDFVQNDYNGKTYPSLAEQTYQELFKNLSKKPTHDNIQYFFGFLDEAIDTFLENVWLLYYKAKILSTTQKYDEALKVMIIVLRKKNSEYWAWKFTGELFEKLKNHEMAISCYSQAMLCNVEEDKQLSVRANILPILIKDSLFAEAVIEINKILISNNEKSSRDLQKYKSTSWWNPNASSSASNNEFYKQRSASASELIHYDLPWNKATFIEIFRTKRKNSELGKLLVETEAGKLVEAIASSNGLSVIKNLTPGQAVKAKYTVEGEKVTILAIDVRSDGSAWDILPSQMAVVDHVNHDKNIVHCISVNQSNISFIHRSRQKDMLTELYHIQCGRTCKIRS